jgi:hypothetical protein
MLSSMPETTLLPSIASGKQQRIRITKVRNNSWTGPSEHRRQKKSYSESAGNSAAQVSLRNASNGGALRSSFGMSVSKAHRNRPS